MSLDPDASDTPTRVPEALVSAVRRLVHKLVLGEYDKLIQSEVAAGWASDSLAAYVAQMQQDDAAPLVDLPDAFFDAGNTTLSLGEGRFSVCVRLWTSQGPSAYSLVIDFEPAPDGYSAHFENLEIM